MGCNCRGTEKLKRIKKINKDMAKEEYKWAKHITDDSCITIAGKRYWVSNCTEAHMKAFYKNGHDSVELVNKSSDGKKEN